MNKNIFFALIYLTLLCGRVSAQGVQVSPVIPDFTDINAGCVEATYGFTNNPFQHTGVSAGRHTVISGQGTDPNTGNKLKFLPDGENKVVRLGNEQIWREAESITYHFIVDKEKSILLLKFAVVFQDPSHSAKDQPRFVVRIKNAGGELIEGCAEYDVSARAEIEGFQTYNAGGNIVRWRDWTNVGLDMSGYAGQEVQVQLITYDCAFDGHYGYAYFTASCVSNKLSLEACNGQDITISAPAGFRSYLWSGGDTTPSVSLNTGGKDKNLSCEITSATGCRFTLSAFISGETALPAENHIYYDTICEGDAYTSHDFKLPPQTETGTFTYYNNYLDIRNCKGDVTTTLFLTVQKRYYPLVASICQGESYTGHHFSIIRPAPGIHYDTLRYTSAAGCDSVISLTLYVSANFAIPGRLSGNDRVCTGSVETYMLPGADQGADTYRWEVPRGYNILSGQGTREVRIQFSGQANSGVILLHGANGCGEGTVQLGITVNPGYWQAHSDTVCAGDEYHKNGFSLPPQDSSGVYPFVQSLRTKEGCDSVISLYLSVFPPPTVKITVSDSLLCNGDEVRLQASSTTDMIYSGPLVAVGDILCADGTTVKPGQYLASGKTAVAVVFWVDRSGKHGWAVHLDIGAEKCQWKKSSSVTNPSRPEYPKERSMLADTSGYLNTRAFWESPDKADFPILGYVDFNNGWYIPSISQLNILNSAFVRVNASLKLTGGKVMGATDEYWSSTLYSEDKFWCIYLEAMYSPVATEMRSLRVIRTF